jgi:hypothetical protein
MRYNVLFTDVVNVAPTVAMLVINIIQLKCTWFFLLNK